MKPNFLPKTGLVNRLSEVILTHRALWVILVTVLVIVSGYGIKWLRFDSSNESFLPDADALHIANEVFKDTFGNEEFVFLLVESDQLLSKDILSRLRALQEDLENNLPFIREVNAITNMDFMDSVNGYLDISEVIPEDLSDTPDFYAAIKQKLSSSKMVMGKLITEDWRYTGISITFEHMPEVVWVDHPTSFSPVEEMDWPDEDVIMMDRIYFDQTEVETPVHLVKVVDARKLIAPALKVILKRHRAENMSITATGIPVMDFEGDRLITEEASRLGVIGLIAATVVLLILFRSLAAILAPVTVIVFTIVFLFGVMGWLDIAMSLMSIIVAPLLIVISVSYSIHYINHFNYKFRNGANRRDALKYAYQQATWPCFLTAVTTCVGFISFLVVPMEPIRDIGLTSGLGVLIACFFVMIIVPVFYSIGPNQHKIKPVFFGFQSGSTTHRMARLGNWVVNHKIIVSIVALIICGVSVFQISRVKVETDFFSIIGRGIPYIDKALSITDILGGQYSYEVMIELPEPEMAKDPEVLKAMDQIAEFARKWPNTATTTSIADMIKEINYVLHDRNENFHAIPETRRMIAQYLLLYEMSGGDTLSDWVDTNYQKLRLSVQLVNTDRLEEQVSTVRQNALRLFPEGTKISTVGDVPVMIRLMNLLTQGQIKSILVAFLAIGVIMIIILRSVKAGLISLIPNMFPVLVILGTMGLMGFNLDMITVMIAPMIIGIAVDDTVHFFIHFKDELSDIESYDWANQNTFLKIGNALLFTSIVLTFGFIVFGFSDIQAIVSMGVLAAIGILSALMADLFIAPVLIVVLKPFGKKITITSNQDHRNTHAN